jgi:hypothetical protein
MPVRWIALLLPACLCLSGCPKRDTGEINVDQIQNVVDSIEDNLKSMRSALKAKNLAKAEDHYEEAAEAMEENQTQLSAYPEVGLLKERVLEAESDLCYGFASISLAEFFDAIRGKSVGGARSKLKVAKREFERCKPKIESRDDFMALQMNLDTAPQSLKDLEKELLRDVWLKEIASIKKECGEKINSIRGKLARLNKQPNQKELALEVSRDIRSVREAISKEKEFSEDPEWLAVAGTITGEIQELDNQRASLVRRGKILWVVKEVLPKASKSATMAVTTRNRAEALKKVDAAYKGYSQCEDLLNETLKEEKELGKFTFLWRGARKNARWLRSHCKANRRITERMVAKLSGKRPPKKKEVKETKETKEAKETKETKETPKPPKKKKKKRKRKGRIRRW